MNLVRELEVAGTNFRDAATKALLESHAGVSLVPVRLEPEPTNPHDPLAVKVILLLPDAPTWVGYWPKTTSGWALLMWGSEACQAPLTAKVAKHPSTGRVIVLLSAELP